MPLTGPDVRTADDPTIHTGRRAAQEPPSTAVALLAVLIALALAVGAGQLLSRARDPASAGPSPDERVRDAAAGYLRAWERADYAAMAAAIATPGVDPRVRYEALLGGLRVSELRAGVAAVERRGDRAEVAFAATLELAGLGSWTYRGAMPFVEVDGSWLVEWSPAVVHPALSDGGRLEATREWPARAAIVGTDGSELGGGSPLPVLDAQLVGRIGPASAERAAELGPPYVEGDPVGVTGLQAALEPRLAGRPSGDVLLVDAGGAPVRRIGRIEGVRPAPVTVTIDPRVQAAAEAALPRGLRAALVAIDAPTGEVRAVVSRPAAGFNRAFEGRYPPGSTFKVVTAYALLAGGLDPDEAVECPASTVVRGRRIGNAQGEALGTIPFRRAFYRSCNTAFVRLADRHLDAVALAAAAERFGFGAEPDVALPAAGGSFPAPESAVELVAAAIGQARVTASPLQMASVAAAVSSGAWRPPVLVDGDRPGSPRPLDAPAAATLRELMRLVVDEGTGTAARVAGQPVAGKTGTAEFGRRVPPRTHAWFIGFRGDTAFAVVVEDAGFGGEVAAPIAAEFLSILGP